MYDFKASCTTIPYNSIQLFIRPLSDEASQYLNIILYKYLNCYIDIKLASN